MSAQRGVERSRVIDRSHGLQVKDLITVLRPHRAPEGIDPEPYVEPFPSEGVGQDRASEGDDLDWDAMAATEAVHELGRVNHDHEPIG